MAEKFRAEPSQRLAQVLGSDRLIAVLRAGRAEELVETADVLVNEGIRLIELTMTTTGALDMIPRMRDRYGAAAVVGLGTVRDVETVERALGAGAQFLVTPCVVPEVVERLRVGDVPVLSGALTPTEIDCADRGGADAVKIFPASTVGPAYLGDIAGPFPSVHVVPSGGIALDDVERWLRAGAMAVSLGGSLISGDADELRRRARYALAAVQGSS